MRNMKNQRPRKYRTISSGSYTLDILQLTNGESMHISGDVELTIKDSFMIDNADIILAED